MKLPTVVRRWAYGGALVGAGVSIAANVLHSYVPPDGLPATWRPAQGAVIGAIFWPLALLVAIEIFARWHPTAFRFKVLRWAGLVPVAVVAAVVSYRHMSGLLSFWREDPITVVIGPLAVDGLMVMAAGALIATSPPTWSAGSSSGWPAGAIASWADVPPVRDARVFGDRGGMTDQLVRDVTPPVGADGRPDGPNHPDDATGVPGRAGGGRPADQQDSPRDRAALLAAMRSARTDNPRATQDDVALVVGKSKRTVARYWNWPDAMPVASPNGAKHDP